MDYTIRSGDTLSQIAQQNNTTVGALAKANNIADPNMIRAGANLRINPVKPINPSDPINPGNLNQGGAYNPDPVKPLDNMQSSLDALEKREQTPIETVNPKDQIQQGISNLLNRDITAEKSKLREDAQLIQKQQEYNTALAEYKNRKASYQERINEMRKNPDGMSRAGVTAQIEEYQRKANQDLANMAIGVELMQNNYIGAEKILNDQIADIQTDYTNRLNTLSAAYSFLQNDLSESEKLQAEQVLKDINREKDFEIQKAGILYNQQLQQSDPLYQANLRAKLVEVESAEANKKALEDAIKRGEIVLTKEQRDTAFKLQDDFEKESDEFVKVADAYDRIIESAADPSAAGDLALIFNYMKVLDPGSTVREGEFKTAAAAGSYLDRVYGFGLKLGTGQRLSPSQREDFVNRATKLYGTAASGQQMRDNQYYERASMFGVPGEAVIRDVYAQSTFETASSYVDAVEETLANPYNNWINEFTSNNANSFNNFMSKYTN